MEVKGLNQVTNLIGFIKQSQKAFWKFYWNFWIILITQSESHLKTKTPPKASRLMVNNLLIASVACRKK